MHFTKFLATSALLVATGVAAIASPEPAHNDFAPLQVGRRLSRKAIQRRHYRHHHHHNNNTDSATPTDATIESVAPEPTSTDGGDNSGDCSGDEPAVVTVYTTITTTPSDAQPTDNGSATASAPPAATQSTPTSGNGPANPGATIVATGSPCGDPNAVPDPAATSGPNGDENWLNCGVDGNGWVPPPITFDNLIYRDLGEVLNAGGSPFDACSQYLTMFQQAAADTGIPEIFLASIALQESGCNPSVTGGAGEIGMMQITSEKCPSGGDCYDAATNIGIGAQYFKTVLDDQCNGNVACTMGAYNGWQPGLTVQSANNYAICAQHNNLDYLQNVFNGYLQGVDPGSLNMGIYHNTC